MPSPTIDELILADEPRSWSALGFTVEGEICQLGSVRVRLVGKDAGRGILGWSLRDIATGELDGLSTAISAAPLAPAAAVHPNGVMAIDHIVAMSPAFDRSVNALEHAGLDLRRIREQPTPAGAPRQAFFRLGSEILELVAEPDEIVARNGGPERPAHFWGLALLSEDIERTAAAWGEHCGDVRAAVQPGRRIATLRRSAGLAVPIALMSVKQPSEEHA